MKRKNYLDNIPKINKTDWHEDTDGVIIKVKSEGFFYKTFRFFTKQPEYTYFHLDKVGSFIWTKIDGKRKISDFAPFLTERFSKEINPVYPRLANYFEILRNSGFVVYK